MAHAETHECDDWMLREPIDGILPACSVCGHSRVNLIPGCVSLASIEGRHRMRSWWSPEYVFAAPTICYRVKRGRLARAFGASEQTILGVELEAAR